MAVASRAVTRAGAHVVDRAQWREVGGAQVQLRQAGTWHAEQTRFERGEAFRGGRTTAHRDAGRTDPAVGVDIDRQRHHRDRDHEVAARAELGEDGSRPGAAPRHKDAGQQFIRRKCRAPVAEHEVSHGQAPLAVRRLQQHLRVQRQPDGRAIRGWRRIAQVAAECGGVLDLLAADFARREPQRVEEQRQLGALYVSPGRRRAEPPALCFGANRPQGLDARQVEQR
jgi:hypothetical protein